MTPNKAMIKILEAIVHGNNTTKDIAKAVGLSRNRCSSYQVKLEETGFITKKRANRKIYVNIGKTPYAQKFKELVIAMPAVKPEDFLVNTRFRMLSCCLIGWKSAKDIAAQLNIPIGTVQNNIPNLRDRGLLMVEKRRYKFNREIWPKVYSFLYAYRTFSSLMIDILWKFEDESLFEVNEEQQIKGVLTGFNAYERYGVNIHNVKYYCYLPEKRLSKEEIFVHSLLQIKDDPRALDLAIVFYKKNKLSIKKLNELAVRYDLYPILQDFVSVIQALNNTNIERITPKILPEDSRKEIEETLKLYNTKW